MKIAGLGEQVQVVKESNRASLGDLLWTLVVGVVLFGLVALSEFIPGTAKLIAPLRIPLGIIYVLFAPGYLLQAVLFPRRGDLDGIERIGLSLGLSIALIPLLALLLDRLPWGLRLWPIVIGQSFMILSFFVAAVVRRVSLRGEEVNSPDMRIRPQSWWGALEPSNRRLLALVGIAVIFASLAAAWIFLVPSDAENMTEFYMLGKDGLAESYPREVSVGDPVSLLVGINNREGENVTYEIRVMLNEQLIGHSGPITLEKNDSWEQPVDFTVPIPGDDQEVIIILDRIGQTSAYRTLRLWLDVIPADTP